MAAMLFVPQKTYAVVCSGFPALSATLSNTDCVIPLNTVMGTDNAQNNDASAVNTSVITLGNATNTPGQPLNMTIYSGAALVGGSINIRNNVTLFIDQGGQLLPGKPLYVPDSDQDGFAGSFDLFVATASGRRRLGLMRLLSRTDCNDQSNAVGFQGGPWYQDTDGDGFGNAAATSDLCTIPVGYVANNSDCSDGYNSATNNCKMVATGGTITTSGNYKIHTFTSSGTFTVTAPGTAPSVQYLIVAGGGGGGYGPGGSTFRMGGGGGAGGLVTGTATLGQTSYPVVVGGGGAGGNNCGYGSTGGNSTAFGLVAYGGGGGGGCQGYGGITGGCGGGSAGNNALCTGGGGGYQGGGGGAVCDLGVHRGGAGGGGMGAGVGNGNNVGGAGLANSISGVSVTYSRGGDANSNGCGYADNGAANSGNGGGGALTGSSCAANGGSGGSGIVILKYLFQ